MASHSHVISINLISVGNSKGVRLPKTILTKYGFTEELLLEEKPNGIFIRSRHKKNKKLSWKETYRAIAKEKESWNDFEAALNDGLEGDDF